jgi:hypothetical protein
MALWWELTLDGAAWVMGAPSTLAPPLLDQGRTVLAAILRLLLDCSRSGHHSSATLHVTLRPRAPGRRRAVNHCGQGTRNRLNTHASDSPQFSRHFSFRQTCLWTPAHNISSNRLFQNRKHLLRPICKICYYFKQQSFHAGIGPLYVLLVQETRTQSV